MALYCAYIVWRERQHRVLVVMTAAFAVVALFFTGLVRHQSRLAAAEHEGQIAKLDTRVNNIIAGHRLTLDQISASLIRTPATEALEALDRLVDARQVEEDVLTLYEVVGRIPRESFLVRVFHHKDLDRQIVPYDINSSYCHGWMELAKITDFKRGDQLKLWIGGTATRIWVQLLPVDHPDTEPYGMLGPFEVSRPADTAANPDARGTLSLTLPEDFPNTRRISVHGAANPTGPCRSGDSHGPATLLSAQLVPR
ncbi:MAG: hypothetical protein WA005_13935 [Candidatus Binataceae bacterium]